MAEVPFKSVTIKGRTHTLLVYENPPPLEEALHITALHDEGGGDSIEISYATWQELIVAWAKPASRHMATEETTDDFGVTRRINIVTDADDGTVWVEVCGQHPEDDEPRCTKVTGIPLRRWLQLMEYFMPLP